MGSIEAARRAGMVQAEAAQKTKSAATVASTSGLE
jgi:hypothetical protein